MVLNCKGILMPKKGGNSLAAQWLGLQAFTAKGIGSISGQGIVHPYYEDPPMQLCPYYLPVTFFNINLFIVIYFSPSSPLLPKADIG